jgi:hypothetical protein
MRSGLAVVALVLWLAPAVSGADVFRYETEEGTIAFTDDVKRVPARYRDQAALPLGSPPCDDRGIAAR